jgi:hypothetical protein
MSRPRTRQTLAVNKLLKFPDSPASEDRREPKREASGVLGYGHPKLGQSKTDIPRIYVNACYTPRGKN